MSHRDGAFESFRGMAQKLRPCEIKRGRPEYKNNRNQQAFQEIKGHKKSSVISYGASGIRRQPTLPPSGSTIGTQGLNFSVRNGKRWITLVIDTF